MFKQRPATLSEKEHPNLFLPGPHGMRERVFFKGNLFILAVPFLKVKVNAHGHIVLFIKEQIAHV